MAGGKAELVTVGVGQVTDLPSVCRGCAAAVTAAGNGVLEVVSGAETNRIAGDVAAHFGRIDMLVNRIGPNREEKAEEVTEKKFDHAFDVKGAMFQALAAAGHMIRQGGLAILCKQLAAGRAPHRIKCESQPRPSLERRAGQGPAPPNGMTATQ